MRALKSVFTMLRAQLETFMRGELSRTTKSFQIESRLENRSYYFVRLKILHFEIVQNL